MGVREVTTRDIESRLRQMLRINMLSEAERKTVQHAIERLELSA